MLAIAGMHGSFEEQLIPRLELAALLEALIKRSQGIATLLKKLP